MVERGPSVRVQGIQVCIAISDDGAESDTFLRLRREDDFVDRSLTSDTHPFINQLSAVDEVLQVLMVAFVGGIIKVLKDATCELITTHL